MTTNQINCEHGINIFHGATFEIKIQIKANFFYVSYHFHRIPKYCAFITLMITTLLTLMRLGEISFHFHENNEMSLEYLPIANLRNIFINFIHRIMICIDIFKRFQIVIVDGIFNISNMFNKI